MIFGTDGIRGIVDVSIDSKLAYKVGKAYADRVGYEADFYVVAAGDGVRKL